MVMALVLCSSFETEIVITSLITVVIIGTKRALPYAIDLWPAAVLIIGLTRVIVVTTFSSSSGDFAKDAEVLFVNAFIRYAAIHFCGAENRLTFKESICRRWNKLVEWTKPTIPVAEPQVPTTTTMTTTAAVE